MVTETLNRSDEFSSTDTSLLRNPAIAFTKSNTACARIPSSTKIHRPWLTVVNQI